MPDDPAPNAPKGPREDPKRPRNLLLLIVVGIGLVTLWLVGRELPGREPLSANALGQALDLGQVEKIKIISNELRAEVTVDKDSEFVGRGGQRVRDFHLVGEEDALQLKVRAEEAAAKRKAAGGEPKPLIAIEPASTFLAYFANFILPWVLLIGVLWFFVFRQMRNVGQAGGLLSFGRSRAHLASADQISITFDDVAGIDDSKAEVQEIIEFLKNPERFRRLGGRIPRGILLVGQPGCGKTLLAKAIAGEASVPFFSMCGSDFVEMFVGVGASRVRDLFKQAKERSPCIVFLDEIDAVGRKRGTGMGGGHDEREQTLNAILVEMDGFETDEGVIVLAATNRPDVLDPALLRPGRFDRQVVIDMPDLAGRESILKVHARKTKLAKDADMGHLARGTSTFSGAELEALINEAAILAAMKNQDAVAMDDLEEARDKVKWGRQKRSRVIEEEDRKVTAYHEAGHALVAALHEDVEPVHKVTIVPRGPALGATMQLPERDQYHFQKKRMMGTLAVLYGGRIAEQMFCGDISAGASSDIEQASSLARRMVCEWGMSSEVGPIDYGAIRDSLYGEVRRPASEQTSVLIDKEVRAIIDQSYKTAEKLVTKNRDKVESIAQALLKYETLSGKDITQLVAGEEPEVAIRTRAEEKARAEEKDKKARADKPVAEPVASPSEPRIEPRLA